MSSRLPSTSTREMKALGLLALVALAALVRLALPLGVGLFLGALLGFTLQPVYGRLRARRLRAVPAALVCTLGATTLVSALVAGMMTIFVTRGVSLVMSLSDQLAPHGELRVALEHRMKKLSSVHIDPDTAMTKLQEQAGALGARAAGLAAEAAGATANAMLTLLFMALATYFVLLHWNDAVSRAETMLPFEARHTHALMLQFRKVGREVLRGTVVTGLVQGVFAAIGYALTGVPDPLFFGALTAAASLVPAGTVLVWVPIGIYLLATGRSGAGLCELLYGTFIIGIIPDYVIRPKLVGSDKGVPAVFTFIGLFGGVQVFGFIGLILGPVLVSLAIAVLRAYDTELHAERGT